MSCKVLSRLKGPSTSALAAVTHVNKTHLNSKYSTYVFYISLHELLYCMLTERLVFDLIRLALSL